MENYRSTLKNNTWSECKSVKQKSEIFAKEGRRMVTLLMILFTSCIYKFRLVSMVSASVLSIVLGKCSIQVTFCCKACCEHPLEVIIPCKKVVFFQKKIWVLRNNCNVQTDTMVTFSLKIWFQILQAKSNIFLSSSLTVGDWQKLTIFSKAKVSIPDLQNSRN